MRPEDDTEDWSSYRRLVLTSIKEMKDDIGEIKGLCQGLHDDMLTLKVKTALVSGFIGIVVSAVATWAFGKF